MRHYIYELKDWEKLLNHLEFKEKPTPDPNSLGSVFVAYLRFYGRYRNGNWSRFDYAIAGLEPRPILSKHKKQEMKLNMKRFCETLGRGIVKKPKGKEGIITKLCFVEDYVLGKHLRFL